MAMIDDRSKLSRGFLATKDIQAKATGILGLSGSVPFDSYSRAVNQMVSAYVDSVQPLTLLTQAQINGAVTRQFPLGAPANTFTALATFQSAVTSFLTDYKAIFDGLPNQVTFSVTSGHQPASIASSTFSSLSTSLTNIINAATPLILDQ